MNNLKIKILFVVKVVSVIIPAFILLWLINQNYALTGRVKYVYNIAAPTSKQIISLEQRDGLVGVIGDDGKMTWQQANDNLKFKVKLRRYFDEVSLNIGLKNISQKRIDFEALGAVGKEGERKIVREQILDELSWPTVTENNLTLWQRPERYKSSGSETASNEDTGDLKEPIKQYGSLSEFYNNLPDPEKIGVVGLSKEEFIKIPDYVNDRKLRIIPHYFRGNHTLYTYVGEGDSFSFSFNKIDLNYTPGPDNLTVKIFLGSDLVFSETFVDDGNTMANGVLGPSQNCAIEKDLKPGYYRVQIDASDDVLFHQVQTRQRNLFFARKIFLAEGDSYIPENTFNQFSIKTDSREIFFQTPHEAGTGQVIMVGQNINSPYQNISIEEVKKNYQVTNLVDDNYLTIPKGDIYITGNNFVFEGFEIPKNTLSPFLDSEIYDNTDEIDYILASYSPGNTFGSVNYRATYKVDDLLVNDSLYFNISCPGLKLNGGRLEIKYIEVTLTGKSLGWQKISEKLKNFINKL